VSKVLKRLQKSSVVCKFGKILLLTSRTLTLKWQSAILHKGPYEVKAADILLATLSVLIDNNSDIAFFCKAHN